MTDASFIKESLHYKPACMNELKKEKLIKPGIFLRCI